MNVNSSLLYGFILLRNWDEVENICPNITNMCIPTSQDSEKALMNSMRVFLNTSLNVFSSNKAYKISWKPEGYGFAMTLYSIRTSLHSYALEASMKYVGRAIENRLADICNAPLAVRGSKIITTSPNLWLSCAQVASVINSHFPHISLDAQSIHQIISESHKETEIVLDQTRVKDEFLLSILYSNITLEGLEQHQFSILLIGDHNKIGSSFFNHDVQARIPKLATLIVSDLENYE